MKDLPHHLKKLNRRVIRSMHREEMDEESFEMPDIPPQKPTAKQVRKKAKIKMRNETRARTPLKASPDERNKKMKKRVPVFDRHKTVKRARPTKKKTPKIKTRAKRK